MKPIKTNLVFTALMLMLVFPAIAQTKDSTSTTSKDPDYSKPIFDFKGEQLTNKNRSLRYSAITGYREGAMPIKNVPYYKVDINQQQGTTRFYMINLSIQDMVTHGYYKNDQVILNVKDPSKYRYDPTKGPEEEWLRKNGHCYELMLPTGVINEKVLDDFLAGVLGLKFGPQKKNMDVLVLVRTSQKDKIKSAGKGDGKYDSGGNFNNTPLDSLSHPIEAAGLPMMVNETGYKSNVDLKLNIKSWNDIETLRKRLNQYDLDLRPEKRELSVFVITETR